MQYKAIISCMCMNVQLLHNFIFIYTLFQATEALISSISNSHIYLLLPSITQILLVIIIFH